ncbi:MAG: peptidylprolyl isomerase [Planctomycetes bacterium]|nr:peptidylprolyl isomerase [Planctomycetota bacterium]MCH9723799.1 peptidylprolyl isomerase [Planctomycetota bacterium]MCH9776111.1 peptidylprolyl isomerase [Planctomycetota bacterium]MCH9791406.1 peptidylprolyl isomerase [Planctomycetota bacterium]MDF1742962.1 peptidylprolyl isomerase [Gimesia sp.]
MRTPLPIILNVCIISLCCAFPTCTSLWAADQANDTQKVLVTVNGQTITQADLDFAYLSRGIAGRQRPARQQILESLVNQRLIQAFLTQQKITVPPEQLEESVLRIQKLILKKGDQPEQVLTKMGFTPEKLRTAIALPLSWNIYAKREITAAKIQDYFNQHQEELDGTRVEASHILLKLPKNSNPETVQQARQKLVDLREKILAKKLSFKEAAAQHSEAPSKNEGGKLVTSAYRGKMPLALTEKVFPLKVGEISAPFQTPFGVHIVTLNKKHPGQFSLEDVRGEIYRILSRALWDSTIQSLRSKAKIDWKTDSEK